MGNGLHFGLNGIAPASWLSGQLTQEHTPDRYVSTSWDGYGYASGDIALMGLCDEKSILYDADGRVFSVVCSSKT